MATSQLEVMANEMITLSMEKQIKNQATQIEALKKEIIGLKAINQSKLTPEDFQVLAKGASHYEQAVRNQLLAELRISAKKAYMVEESPEAPSILVIRRRAMEK